MIDARDVARKILAGCGHIAPVILPCKQCIEAQIQAWEVGVRQDCKVALADEWKRIEAAIEKSKKDLETANAEMVRLKSIATTLTSINESLKSKLVLTSREVAELRVMLKAEQTAKTIKKMATA